MTLNRSHFLMGVPFLTGALIALLSPLDVLEHEAFRAIYELAAAIVPAVRKMKGDYELGQVAMLYQSATWLMSPLTVAGAYINASAQTTFVLRTKEKWLLSFCCFVIVLPAVAVFFAVANHETNNLDDWRAMLAFHSRFGMVFFGYLVSSMAAVSIGISMVYWRNLNSIFSK